MRHMHEGHEKLIKVILNKKIGIKLNYQELEEINFALSDRFNKLKEKSANIKYLKFLKNLIIKVRNKIDIY
jgi:hypothetical protein